MTYLSDKKRKISKVKLAFLVILFFLLTYFWFSIRTYVRAEAESLPFIYSAVKEITTLLPNAVSLTLTSKNTLAKENSDLKKKVEQLQNELALNRIESIEQVTISEERASTTVQTAKIKILPLAMYPLMQDISSIYGTILLSRGANDGVLNDMLVYIQGRGLVCKVVTVNARTAICKLFTSPKETVDGVIGTTTLTLYGDGGGAYIADSVRGSNINEGDTIYFKSDETMTLGTVASVKRDPQAAFEKVYVRGVYSPTQAHIFYVDKQP